MYTSTTRMLQSWRGGFSIIEPDDGENLAMLALTLSCLFLRSTTPCVGLTMDLLVGGWMESPRFTGSKLFFFFFFLLESQERVG